MAVVETVPANAPDRKLVAFAPSFSPESDVRNWEVVR